MALKKGLRRGFTLVELMIVVAIIGVLAALAIYGVRRYVFTAKTSEAKTAVGRMAKDASNAYNAEMMAGDIVTLGGTVGNSNALCASASEAVPQAITSIQGKKYQSSPSDWSRDATSSKTGFSCMSFTMSDPQYYQYDYEATNVAAVDGTFTAMAHGDLDGDTTTSTFSLMGQIQQQGTELVVTVAPNFTEDDPLE